jgi:hypothetical protein
MAPRRCEREVSTLLQLGQLRFAAKFYSQLNSTRSVAEPRTPANSQPRVPAERSRFDLVQSPQFGI